MNALLKIVLALLTFAVVAAEAILPVSIRAPGLSPNITAGGSSSGGLFAGSANEPDRYVIFASDAANLVTNSLPVGVVNVYRRDRMTARTEWLSVTSSGAAGSRRVVDFSASRAGDQVAFVWTSNDPSAGDTNDLQDVYLRDATAGITRLVSVRVDGQGAGNGESGAPALAGGGRFVAFESAATDLVTAEDTNRMEDVFLRDLETGVTELISAAPSGVVGDRPAQRPIVSRDGDRVVFTSESAGLAPVEGLATDLIIWTRGGSALQRVILPGSVSPAPRLPLAVHGQALSDDGRYLAFTVGSAGNTPVPYTGVWWMDLATGDLRRASGALPVAGGAVPDEPSMSTDGRTLAFTVLLGSPTPNQAQVRIWTPEAGLQTMAERQLTVPPTGSEPAESFRAVLAGDATSLMFFTSSPVPEAGVSEDDGEAKLYHRILATGQTRLIAAESVVFAGEMSSSGDAALWETMDPVLEPGDDNAALDVVLTHLGDGRREVVSVIAPMLGPAAALGRSTGGAGLSDDGRVVAFMSDAEDVIVGDTNRVPDGFIFDAPRNQRVTAAPSGTGFVARTKELVVSRSGRWVAFVTAANGWTDGDTNTTEDVYVRDLALGTTTLASARDGTDVSLDLIARDVCLSGDGRWISFTAQSPSTLARSNALYLRDLATRTTTLVNAPSRSGLVLAGSHQMSSDGQTLLFYNAPSQWWLHLVGRRDLIPVVEGMNSVAWLSPNGRWVGWFRRQISDRGLWIRAIPSGEERMVVDAPQSAFREITFSADGSVLAFVRRSDPERPPAGNPWQVWALSVATGVEELISQTPSGAHGAGDSRAPQISADGRFIAFRTAAPGLVSSDMEDDGGTLQVLVRDRYTRKTHRLSESAEGIPGNWHSTRPEISGDGRWAAFTSFANNLFSGDGNELEDVFLTRIPQEPAPDSDGDGLPDGWERDRLGDLTRDGRGDTDGDGHTDAEEWQSRTDPKDATSHWRVEAVFEGSIASLQWVGHAGVTYQVEQRDSLIGSTWTPVGDLQPGYEGLHSARLQDGGNEGYYRVKAASPAP